MTTLVDRTVSKTPVEFGPALLKDFLIDPEYHNLNHAQSDIFLRHQYPALLEESRAALAEHLNAPVETLILAANATTALNIIIRNFTWADDGKDEIISFSTIYGACEKTVEYLIDTNPGRLSSRTIPLTYPLEDDTIVDLFRAAVEKSRSEGKRPRVAIYDVVTSQPGVRFPFEAVTKACRELGVVSLVDGAQGIGMVPIDLTALDADYFLSNCHKWLHVPRGCAVVYVPVRNHAQITSTLPTSHSYVTQTGPNAKPRASTDEVDPVAFAQRFAFIGAWEVSPYCCVKDAVQWRKDVLGGEQRILDYLWKLAKEGGRKTAEILGTEVLDNVAGTLTNCAMVNVFLPIEAPAEDELLSQRSSSRCSGRSTRRLSLWVSMVGAGMRASARRSTLVSRTLSGLARRSRRSARRLPRASTSSSFSTGDEPCHNITRLSFPRYLSC
ncbi:lolT-1 [Verticillium alfalfae VaMs.102]|uniref:LolT-1 n=1 Tax=Verticillium alfalfae (strain VaMs.102 / ATCC MYA-4576 / FGSC 10136) TaxID=526221 RepID=C9SUH3_VERA1|nr:lolT-1 [Verticillium alfalfae VaMs.102]EEY22484.1 lolT-1 [Verticillium alfalfae VaMs.102]